MTNFNNKPFVEVNKEFEVWNDWGNICSELDTAISKIANEKKVIVIETYQGVIHEELIMALQGGLKYDQWISSSDLMKNESEVNQMIYPDITNDRIFGYLSRLKVKCFRFH